MSVTWQIVGFVTPCLCNNHNETDTLVLDPWFIVSKRPSDRRMQSISLQTLVNIVRWYETIQDNEN